MINDKLNPPGELPDSLKSGVILCKLVSILFLSYFFYSVAPLNFFLRMIYSLSIALFCLLLFIARLLVLIFIVFIASLFIDWFATKHFV